MFLSIFIAVICLTNGTKYGTTAGLGPKQIKTKFKRDWSNFVFSTKYATIPMAVMFQSFINYYVGSSQTYASKKCKSHLLNFFWIFDRLIIHQYTLHKNYPQSYFPFIDLMLVYGLGIEYDNWRWWAALAKYVFGSNSRVNFRGALIHSDTKKYLIFHLFVGNRIKSEL